MNFDDLLLKATEKSDAKTLNALLCKIESEPLDADRIGELELLLESWSADVLENDQAQFLLKLALLELPPDSPVIREKVAMAIKQTLPPYLARTGLLRALGVRDTKISFPELMRRCEMLKSLKSGMVIYLGGAAKRFGMAGNLDNVAATLTVGALGAHKTAMAVPLETVLRDGVLLNPGAELSKIIDVSNRANLTCRHFKMLLNAKALFPIDEETIRQMARSGAAHNMDAEAFELWFSEANDANNAANLPPASRRAAEGRSLKEIDLLLAKEESESGFSPEEVVKLTSFFAALKPETAARETKLLASIISKLYDRAGEEVIGDILSGLKSHVPFWPEDPGKTKLEFLTVWGELPAKELESFALATATVYSGEYLALLALRLPLKAVNAISAAVDDKLLHDVLIELHSAGSDLLLWVWKNRKKHSEELTELVNIENVIGALSLENLPKIWGTAQRELRTLLLDNSDFQKHLVTIANDDARTIALALQGALFLTPSERQSLLVKLARVSSAIRDYLENGAGEKILSAGTDKSSKISTPKGDEVRLTSKASYKRLADELDDIIRVQVPENREALKTARAHGDFRENSEFDAAKERRNYLTRRRHELERELGRTQQTSFSDIKVGDSALVGSSVELEYSDGKNEVFHLLGAWDGDPDRNHLSYRTRLGEAITGKKVGEKVEIPGNRGAIIKSVSKLPSKLLAELDLI